MLEEEYHEMQFHENYFKEINSFIAPNFQYGEKGNILGFKQPINLSEKDRKILFSYFWEIDANRKFVLSFYEQIDTNIKALKKRIENKNL